MKHIISIVLLMLFLLSCQTDSDEISQSSNELVSDSLITFKEQHLEDSAPDKEIIHSTREDREKPIKNGNQRTRRKDSISDSQDASSYLVDLEVLSRDEDKRKPPVVEQNIVWTESHLHLNYKRTTFADPGVGCSSSEEVMSIHVPIKEQREELLLDTKDLEKWTSSINYQVVFTVKRT